MAFEWRCRVYIEDTDFGGIVYYVNYLKFMERARTEMLRAVGYSQQILKSQGWLFVVHDVQARYLKPSHLDDELIVRSDIELAGASTVIFKQRVVGDAGDARCEGDIRVVCVDEKTLKPRRWPKELLQRLEQLD